MAVVAIETYLITAYYKAKPEAQARINGTITAGYITSLIFGLGFAYFGHNYVYHGLFIAGQVIIFFAGIQLAIEIWPWKKEYRIQQEDLAHTRAGVDLERVALFIMAISTLGSVLFGAIPGSMFGNGFQAFLAEDIIREPYKPAMERAIIGSSPYHVNLDCRRPDADSFTLDGFSRSLAEMGHAFPHCWHPHHYHWRLDDHSLPTCGSYHHQCWLHARFGCFCAVSLVRLAKNHQ